MSRRFENGREEPVQEQVERSVFLPGFPGGAFLVGVLGLAFYFFGVVDPALRNLHETPVLFLDGELFSGAIWHPGGLLQLLAALAAQTEYVPWLAAIVFGLLAVLLFGLLWDGKNCGNSVSRVGLAVLPTVIVVALAGRYEGQLWHLLVGGVMFAAAWRVCCLPPRIPGFARLVIWLGSTSIIAWSTADGFLMCWVGLLFLAAALTRNVEGYLSALAGALSLLVIRWEWSSWQRASWGLDWGDGWEAGLMCGFLLALTLGCLVRVMSGAQGGLAGRLGSLLVYSGMEVRKQLAIGVTLLVALPIVSFNPRQRTLLGIELAARRENWSRVEKLAGGISLLPPEARIQLFRALYHRDLLLKDLFQYSLGVDSDLLPSLYSAGTAVCLPLSDLLLELGHQNLSLRYAHEAMEVMGERPAILERIAGLNLLQGRSHAARIYLNRMSQIPFQAGTAALLLDAVDKARGAFGGIDLDAARELAVDVPQAEMRFGGELLARLAWDSNLSNRMAFELLTAERLWRGDSRSVLHDLGGFQQLGYRQLPRLVQESIAGSVPMADRGSPIVEGWTIDREVMEARAQYGKLRQRSNVSPDVRVLREAFGGTYFFHLDWIQAHGQTQQ